jgi:Cof subfamily protein (haloacid dehalogenase superfamily)
MAPKLFAFDLDGTLLDSGKRISAANIGALREMKESGAAVALASGRIGSGVRRYAADLGFDPALVILNGAEVYKSSAENAERVYYAPLETKYAHYLTEYGEDKPVAVNFYHQDKLYSVWTGRNIEWTHLYTEETGVEYKYVDAFYALAGVSPSKIIYVGEPSYIDELEGRFRALWSDGEVYVCRSWDYYLEFMNPAASKGIGLKALCDALAINLSDTAAYGDAENDIPMLSIAGQGVAMKNSPERVKLQAARVTELTNNEDWVAKEWERWKCL